MVFLTVETLGIKFLLYSSNAMKAQAHYLTEVTSTFTETRK